MEARQTCRNQSLSGISSDERVCPLTSDIFLVTITDLLRRLRRSPTMFPGYIGQNTVEIYMYIYIYILRQKPRQYNPISIQVFIFWKQKRDIHLSFLDLTIVC